MECAERSKRRFLGYRLLGKREAEPVLTTKGKEKELPPLPVQVPLKATGPVAMTSQDMATTTGSPRVTRDAEEGEPHAKGYKRRLCIDG